MMYHVGSLERIQKEGGDDLTQSSNPSHPGGHIFYGSFIMFDETFSSSMEGDEGGDFPVRVCFNSITPLFLLAVPYNPMLNGVCSSC